MNRKQHYYWLGLLTALVAGLCFIQVALGAPTSNNDLDPTFGAGGIVNTPFTSRLVDTNLIGIAVLPDDKMLVASAYTSGVFFTRFNADGSIDTTYGPDGSVFNTINTASASPLSMQVQADGKIVVAGTTVTGFFVERFNSAGSPDTGFGGNGVVTGSGGLAGFVVQADLKIVVGGSVFDQLNYSEVLTRFNIDGSLDTSFASNGILLASNDASIAIVLTPQDQILYSYIHNPYQAGTELRVQRFDTNGSLDTSFGASGTLHITDVENFSTILAPQPDGKIVVDISAPGGFKLARYNSDGTIDSSFGHNGIVTTNFPNFANISLGSIMLQADGKILALGENNSPDSNGVSTLLIARYKTNGALDTTFGSGGIFTRDGVILNRAVIQASGRIVVAQRTAAINIGLLGLTTGGKLDSSFAGRGQSNAGLYNYHSGRLVDAALQPDGKIIAAGYGSDENLVIVRYNTDGSLDNSFGTAGRVTTNSDALGFRLSSIALQPDGKILLGGGVLDATPLVNSAYALLRYTSDGALDTSFGAHGIVTLADSVVAYVPENSSVFHRIAVQADGKILALGTHIYSAGRFTYSYNNALARFNADGSLDSSFAVGGVADKLLSYADSGLSAVNGLTIQADGKILVAGSEVATNYTDFKIIRLNTDGSYDSSFVGGTAFAPAGPDTSPHNAAGSDVTVQADNKIVVTGAYNNALALARFSADGSLDSTFGVSGTVTTTLSAGLVSGPGAIVAQPDGKIVVLGSLEAAGNSIYTLLVRYNIDGSIDPTFGDSGKIIKDFGFANSVYRLLLQSDNKLVLPLSGAGFTLARFQNLTPPATPTIGPGCAFSDVCQSDYFYTPVQYLVSHGAVSGYGDNTFRPYNNATRGQLSKIVVLAEGWGSDTTGGPHFNDVPTTDTFYSFVETAYNKGIISGYTDHTFHPGASVTRGQLAKIMVSAQGWTSDTTGAPHFSDVHSDNPFYEFVETAYNHGLISGYEDGMFRWQNTATRGQIAKIVYAAVSAPARTKSK